MERERDEAQQGLAEAEEELNEVRSEHKRLTVVHSKIETELETQLEAKQQLISAQAELQREVGTLNLHMKKSENVSNQTARRVRRRRRRY